MTKLVPASCSCPQECGLWRHQTVRKSVSRSALVAYSACAAIVCVLIIVPTPVQLHCKSAKEVVDMACSLKPRALCSVFGWFRMVSWGGMCGVCSQRCSSRCTCMPACVLVPRMASHVRACQCVGVGTAAETCHASSLANNRMRRRTPRRKPS